MKMMGRRAIWLSVVGSLWMAGCGGGSGGGTTTVNKTAPSVTSWPTASAITYGQTLASSTLTGGAASVSGSFSWTTSSVTPAAGMTSEGVTFTPSDTTDYNTVTGSASVTVSKATPTVTAWPMASGIAFGQTLASSTLSGGTASVSGTFSWSTPTIVPSGGTPSESVIFTPNDSTDYSTVTGSASLSVSPAKPTVTVTPGSASVNASQSLSVTVTVSAPSGDATPTGAVTLIGGGYTTPTAITLTGGTATITIPASSLNTGNDTLTATYTPDAASSSTYSSATGTGSVTVNSSSTYVLTINSAGPASGISILVSAADNNGASSGTTPFTRTYNSGTQVTLSAPLTSGSYGFVSWSGCASTSGSGGFNCSVTREREHDRNGKL